MTTINSNTTIETMTRPQILRDLLDKVANMGELVDSIPVNNAIQRELFKENPKKFLKAAGKGFCVIMDAQDDEELLDGFDCALMKFKKISPAQMKRNEKKMEIERKEMWKKHAEFEADHAVGGKYYDKEES